MKAPKITVVIPVYKVEQYLDRCVSSVAGQTYQNLEIILVDDGSPDNCPQICEAWAEKDSRIQVVHKENAGLGFARNTGMEYATGDYICFFDSDDYIAEDTLASCAELLASRPYDLVTFGFYKVNAGGDVIAESVPRTPKAVYEGREVQDLFLLRMMAPDPAGLHGLAMNAWSTLYSMDLIRAHGWRFVSERQYISEDRYSLLDLYQHVRSVAVLPKALYYYCENSSSLTHVFRRDRFRRDNECYRACLELAERLGYTGAVQNAVASPYLSNTISTMKRLLATDLPEQEKKTCLREIMGDETLHSAIKRLDLRTENRNRRILILALRLRLYGLVSVLLRLKSRN